MEPAWNAETARQDDPARRFWAFVTTGPLTLLTVASFFAAIYTPAPMRLWWLTAAALASAERVFTFGYFVPTMLALTRITTPGGEDLAAAREWSNLNYLRQAILLAAWLAAMKTFALSYQWRGRRFDRRM